MPFNYKSNLWPNTKEKFFRDMKIKPICQSGRTCVFTVLAMLTNKKPEDFQNKNVNTQDPVLWSRALQSYGMKLAYCPVDVRKIKFYIEELIDLDDLFLLCYYSPNGPEILNDPNRAGWICSSHVVILHRDKIIDSKKGNSFPARKHDCNDHHTKRIFRVVPNDHKRGL